MIQDLKIELSVLLIRTGLFFARCDGEYAESEDFFIKRFLKNLSDNNEIPDSSRSLIIEKGKTSVSLDELLSQTLAFINKLKEDEKAVFVQEMKKFIEELIHADNKIHPKEIENYNLWQKQIDIF